MSSPRLAEDDRFVVAPLLTVDLADPAVITSSVDNATFRASDPRLASVLVAARGARTGTEWISLIDTTLGVEPEVARSIFEQLVATGLVRGDVDSAVDRDIDQWFDHGWGQALTYHLSTRNLIFADVEPGAARPYANLIDSGPPPSWFTEHEQALERIALPAVEPIDSAEPFASMILRRRTNKPWTKTAVRFEELGWLLTVTNSDSTRARWRASREWQTDPSVLLDVPFGAFESYLVVDAVRPLPSGLFHVNLAQQSLDLIRHGSMMADLVSICGNQKALEGCQFAVLIVAEWQRQQFNYRHPRGYRNLFVSAGEFAQSYVMAATALNYSVFLTPATRDELAEGLLEADRYESNLLYVIGIG
ncbi:MAG: SagB/ThcOx family dehydrogenase [Jatrophihabitantaceae bacterium]